MGDIKNYCQKKKINELKNKTNLLSWDKKISVPSAALILHPVDDNQMWLKAAFPFSFEGTVLHVAHESLILSTFEAGVIIKRRLVFVEFSTAVWTNVPT